MLQHIFKDVQVPQMEANGIVGTKEVPKGWVNATAMCKPYGKLFADFYRMNATEAFVEALSIDMGIPISMLIVQIKGRGHEQGTWVHPQIAIDLAGWLSPEFKVWATGALMRIMYDLAQHQAQPELPARQVALETAQAISEIQATLADFDPRIAQILIDHAMRDIADKSPSLMLAGDNTPKLAGVVEIAGDLGFKVGKEESALGKHVARAWRAAFNKEPEKSKRECGGAFRGINIYPRDNEVAINAIKEFYDA